jgi:hypothetical protein
VSNFEPITDPFRIIDCTGTAASYTIIFSRNAETHGYAGNIVSFIFQQHCRDGRIDAAAHSYKNLFAHFHPLRVLFKVSIAISPLPTFATLRRGI